MIKRAAGRRIVRCAGIAGAPVLDSAKHIGEVVAFEKARTASDNTSAAVLAFALANSRRRRIRRPRTIYRAAVVFMIDYLTVSRRALVFFRRNALACFGIVIGVRWARIAAPGCRVVPRAVTLKLTGIGVPI